VGTGVLWLGAQLFKMGLMTLDRPETERERELWKEEGREANAIRIGDKWHSTAVLGPLGAVLVVGGHYAQACVSKVRDKSHGRLGASGGGGGSAFFGGVKSFSEQTFLRNLNVTMDAWLRGGRGLERWTSNMAGMVVPTLVADIARMADATEPRTAGFGLQRIQSYPGTRNLLEPNVTVFGQDLPRYGGNVLEVLLSPSRPAKIREDVVVDEIRRLYDGGYTVAAPTLLGDRKGYAGLTAAENTELWRRAGENPMSRFSTYARR